MLPVSTIHRLASTAVENANYVTYTSAAANIVFWGLHVSDIAVILSAVAAVLGMLIQSYVAIKRLKMLEADMRKEMLRQDIETQHIKNRVAGTEGKAVIAAALATDAAVDSRVVTKRVDKLEVDVVNQADKSSSNSRRIDDLEKD